MSIFKDSKFLTGLMLGASVVSVVFMFTIHVMRLQHRVELVSSSHTAKFNELIYVLNERSLYDVDAEKLEHGLYQGVLDALGDVYAQYVPVQSAERFYERVSGEFGGIGITFEIDRDEQYPIVLGVREDGPAYRAGMQAGDLIIEVDGVDTHKKTSDEIVDLVRGKEGAPTELLILREGENIGIIKIVREIINISSVQFTVIEDQIGALRLDQFIGTSPDELYAAYVELIAEHDLKGIILDLTYNGGGTLDAVHRMSALFLPENHILMRIESQGEVDILRVPKSKDKIDLPIVVLVNEYSASASEVLAGALQDHGRAAIVGNQTFGKGSVQTTFQLSDGSQVLITTSKFFTPDGHPINGVGLVPDYFVEDPDEMIETALGILLGTREGE